MRQELREFRHNLANYCVGLKAKIAGGEYDEALSMIDDMLDKGMNSKNMIINCGNDLIDSLINYKYGIAQKYKIEFQTEILVPEKLAVDYGDLAIILGDLIDNAIEAAKECKEERKIEISMGVKKEELVIVIRNTCAKEPLTDKQGNFMTTKKNAEEHGIGLYSVKKVVKKYEGNTSFQVKDGWFEAIIVVGMLQIVSCPYKSEMLR
jgi:sensor histidine kinase regulating citrate/malate metabolism